jgi:hypothetical protein
MSSKSTTPGTKAHSKHHKKSSHMPAESTAPAPKPTPSK